MQPVTRRKWRVEFIQAPKSRGGSCLVPKPTDAVNRSVKRPIQARSLPAHRFKTVFKACQRRKRNGLMPSQSKNTMLKKLIKLRKKKSKLREADVVYTSNSDKKKKEKLHKKKPELRVMDAVVPVATGLNQDATRKKTSSAQVDAKSKQEEPVEPTSYNKKRPKLDGYEHKEVEYKCTECEFFTLHLGNMKSHKVRHDRKEKYKCDRCSYSARSKSRLSAHSNRFHREQPPALNFKCSDCEYLTLCWNKMKRHRLGHDRQEELKCNRCSFSARLKRHLSFHSNRVHRDLSAALFEVKENHGDNEKLCSRIENMKMKLSTAEKEKKQIMAQKKNVRMKIKKAKEKILKVELALQKLMEKQQNSSDLMDFNRQIRAVRIQQKRTRLDDRERKLKSLKQEECDLDEEEKNAEDSFIGANQVLLALESELIKLEG